VKTRIPVKDGLFLIPSDPDEKPKLMASKCPRCGAVAFPKRVRCQNCQAEEGKTIYLKARGKLYTFTSVLNRPPMFYRGEVPYLLGYVQLPEGIRIRTLLANCALEDLTVGMDMELLIDKLHDDEEGNEVVTYKFQPIKSAQEGTSRK